jgi:hypothetical protein
MNKTNHKGTSGIKMALNFSLEESIKRPQYPEGNSFPFLKNRTLGTNKDIFIYIRHKISILHAFFFKILQKLLYQIREESIHCVTLP